MTRSTQPGLRFRTRKLSPKQLLPVLREDQIDSEEYKELLDNQYKVETGVEKSEENVSLLFLVYIIHISRDEFIFYIARVLGGHRCGDGRNTLLQQPAALQSPYGDPQ